MRKHLQAFLLLAALMVPWATQAQTLTVYDTAAVTNEYVPFYGYYADAQQQNQMIYPATELTAMVGKEITQMVFYVDHVSGSGNIGNWIVSLGETTATTLSGLDNTTSLTQVYSGSMTFNTDESLMTVTFVDGYVYSGGNLLVEFNHPLAAGYKHYYFTGQPVLGASYCYDGQRNFLPKVTFTYETPSACPKPTNLAATLTPGNGTIATLSWTENGTATAWVLEYGTSSDFTGATSVNVTGTPSVNLTGLTAETTYYARVKANCGTSESAWNNSVCEFTPTNAYTLTINDSTSTNDYVPIYGYYADETTQSKFIIPASSLATLQNGTISKLTFYANSGTIAWGSAQFEVYMTETTDTTLSTMGDFTGMTQVMTTGSLSVANGIMEVTLTTPYQYLGGNLMIAFNEAVTGSYSSVTWYGVPATGASFGGYNTTVFQQDFLPKTTFTYNPGQAPTCWIVSNVTATPAAHTVALSWVDTLNSGATYTVYDLSDTSVVATGITATSYTVTGLTSETNYSFGVVANCSATDASRMVVVNVTTEVACPAPTDLYADNITAYAAEVHWSGDAGNYECRYATVANTEQLSYDDGVFLSSVGNGGSTFMWGSMFPAGSYHGTHLASVSVYDKGAMTGRLLIYNDNGTTPTTLVATKEIALTGVYDFADLVFDAPIALDTTKNLWVFLSYESGDSYPASTSASSDTVNARWVGLNGQWYDLANLGVTDRGWMVRANVVSLSAYTPVATTTDTSYSMTGLTPETFYTVQVRANCGNEGYSVWSSTAFQTLPSCMYVSNLTAEPTPTSVILSWEDTLNNGCTYTVYDMSDTSVVATAVSGTTYTVTGLANETTYTFGVVANCSATDASRMVTVTVTTMEDCPAPFALTSANITAHTATLGWTGYSGSYEVRYRETSGSSDEQDFESGFGGWTTIDADGDGYNWVLGSNVDGIYLNGGSLANAGRNGSGNMAVSGSYSNVAGVLTPNNYLVSPLVGLGGTISFWAAAQDASWAAEHFGVAVSTTGNTDTADFTLLQEWTFNAGAKEQSAWVQYTVDLSAYSGQGYVAIRHFNCSDQFFLLIDDVTIEAPTGPWTTATATTETLNILGLDTNTTYEFQVCGICANDTTAWSGRGYFTTLAELPRDTVYDTVTVTACDSYFWRGTTYIASTVAHDTVATATTDSIYVLNLTVNYSTRSTETANAVDNYTWHGMVYTVSGTYFDTLDNAVGCDSICTLNLTVTYTALVDIDSVEACDSYTWRGTTYTASTIAFDTVENVTGADSVYILVLTINYSQYVTDTVRANNSYTWHDNVYTQSGTYYYYGQTDAGCARVETLVLTIDSVPDIYYSVAVVIANTEGLLNVGGTVTGAGSYLSGTEVTLTATPDEGYLFDGWYTRSAMGFGGELISNDSIYTFTLDSNVVLVAMFERIGANSALLTVSVDSTMGYVLFNGDRAPFNVYRGTLGETVTLEAVGLAGNCIFMGWVNAMGDTLSHDAVYDYVLDHTTSALTAVFARPEGIDGVDAAGVTVSARENGVVVRGAAQAEVYVFDVVGRMVGHVTSASDEEFIRLPQTGVFLVKVGNLEARRVVVRQ